MTELTLRQQAIQLMSASGLQPTAQNLQKVQQLIAAGAYGNSSNGSDGGGETGSRTLDRVSGTTAPSHAPPASRPKAPQGKQAGNNSTGPAQLPADADPEAMMQDVVANSFSGNNSTAPAQAEPAPTGNGLQVDNSMWEKILAGAGAIGAGGLGYAALRGARQRVPVIGEVPAGTQPAAPGDVGLGETAGDPTMDPRLNPEGAPPATAGDIGVDENTGTEMGTGVKPDVAREMQPGDVAEATIQRMMGGGDLGVNGPKTTPNLSLEDMLKNRSRVINPDMTVVPGYTKPAEPAVASEGSPIGEAVPSPYEIANPAGEALPEMSMGPDQPNADLAAANDSQKLVNKRIVQTNIDLENSGFDNIDNILTHPDKINKFVDNLNSQEVDGIGKIMAKNGFLSENAKDIKTFLTIMQKIIRR